MSSRPSKKNLIPHTEKFTWEPKHERQVEFRENIINKKISVGLGPAGTGKSTCAAWTLLELLDKNKRGGYNRLFITRPLVSVGKEMGWFPGSKEDKVDPYTEAV